MQLQGSITALTTPFTESGALDMGAWRAQIETQLRAGSAALVVAGSTGEAAALNEAEFCQLIESAIVCVSGRIPVLAGTGLSSTAKTIHQTRLAKESGADVALVVTPPYVRPTQDGLYAHYQAVADAVDMPLVLYNVPGRTGCDLQPQTVARLCRHEHIIGLKEAVGDVARWQALYPFASPVFSLLSGDDPTFVRAMAGGAQGVISVASNVVPAAFARICQLVLERDVAGAQALDAGLRALYDFLGVEPNPVPVKALMRLMGFGQGLRLPLLPLSQVHMDEAKRMLELCNTIEQSI